METLHYSVNGEFITCRAREMLYRDNDLDGALKLLCGCMQSGSVSQNEILGMAVRVLAGTARLKGTYPGDDYEYEENDGGESRLGELSKIRGAAEELKDTVSSLRDRLSFISYNISDSDRAELSDSYRNDFGEELFEDTDDTEDGPQEFFTRDAFDEDAEYGWLEPDGTFHKVPWGAHNAWASEYCIKHDENDGKYVYACDYLVYEKGWVLIHSPGRMLPQATKSPDKNYTKAQKDFLFDFFNKHEMYEEAKKIFEN